MGADRGKTSPIRVDYAAKYHVIIFAISRTLGQTAHDSVIDRLLGPDRIGVEEIHNHLTQIPVVLDRPGGAAINPARSQEENHEACDQGAKERHGSLICEQRPPGAKVMMAHNTQTARIDRPARRRSSYYQELETHIGSGTGATSIEFTGAVCESACKNDSLRWVMIV